MPCKSRRRTAVQHPQRAGAAGAPNHSGTLDKAGYPVGGKRLPFGRAPRQKGKRFPAEGAPIVRRNIPGAAARPTRRGRARPLRRSLSRPRRNRKAARMNKKLKAKIHESLSSVLPVTLIVLALGMTIAPMELSTLMLFLVGAVFLIIGMGFFTLGADMAMMPIGEQVGRALTKSKKLWLIVGCCFLIGAIVTIAEPDLQVLASQTPAVPDQVLILTVAAGVGIFLVVAFLRILFGWQLRWLLIVFYLALFALAQLVPDSFVPVAFDSGGVTTGPITVPFIMALGLGLTAVRGDKDAEDDSFGLVALCSIGPILSVLILGLLYDAGDAAYTSTVIPEITDTRELWMVFFRALPEYAEEVLLALAPILAFFLVFQVAMLHLRRRAIIKIVVGIVYTFIGLTLFLTGVNVGFMPAGSYIGGELGGLDFSWVLVPIGALIGYFIVKAEPAVAVLNKQVEEVTGGTISQGTMMMGLSIGMAVSVGVSMLRVLTGIPVMALLLPGYAVALILSFFVPPIFTAIAFDSGGVASGPMTATFLLPLAMGACEAAGGNILTDAFGVVAMVAMTPLITIQIIGLIYRLRTGKDQPAQDAAGNEIIEFDLADDAGAPGAAPAGDAPQPALEPAPDGDIVEFATFDAAAQPGPAGAAEEEQHE